jgi:Pregnancy-associated plasma protein-A/Secretion system C-terminal sorting domain
MKKITCKLLFLMLLSFALTVQAQKKQKNGGDVISTAANYKNINSANGLIRCSTDENEEILQKNYPKRMTRDQFNTFIEPYVKEYLNTPSNASSAGGIIYIPVVVHVIHNGDAYGVDENIADEQVQSQMTVMTQDFRRMSGTPGFNSNVVGADIQIEFVLAKVDPNGNPTNGIDRVNLCKATYNVGTSAQISAEINANVKPQTIWDPTQYMNMWSVKWDGSGLLGYAQFPSSGTTTANTDGVVSGHTFFGSRTIYPAGNYADMTYDKGRTMTHEVGHFLGLYHTFQGGCAAAGDNCADTPEVSAPNYGCVTGTDSCPSPGLDMLENYMDYTDDSCMNIYTADQKAIIVSVMNTFPRRTTLKTSVKDIAIALFANDAEVKIDGVCNSGSSGCVPTPNQHKILLYNRGTSNLTSATINYNEGGANTVINWTGSILPNKYVLIPVNAVLTTGTFNVSISGANGGTDQRATNNTATKAFTFPAFVTPSNYLYTAFTFTLVGDRYGSETTWNLKNGSGTTLYSGGPYTDRTTNVTQNLVTNQAWNLPADGCYTFTINDSQGDGINSTPTNYGAGFYNIKTNSGLTTVISNTTFSTGSATNTFTNKTLSSADFEMLGGISIYPNPTNSILNIAVMNDLELPNKFEIFNSIGQSILKSNIKKESDLSVNTSSLANGMYFIKIEKDGAYKTLQFVKN